MIREAGKAARKFSLAERSLLELRIEILEEEGRRALMKAAEFEPEG